MTTFSKHLLKSALCWTCALLFFWIFCRYLLPLTAPFLLAFLISRALESPVSFLQKKLYLPRRISSLISTSAFYLILAFISKMIIFRSFKELHRMISSLPDFSVISDNLIRASEDILALLFEDVSPQIITLIQKLISGGFALPTQIRNGILTITSSAATLLPEFFFFIITLIVSTYFFSSDFWEIKAYLLTKLPKKFLYQLSNIKENFSLTVLCYLKALAILALITWIELAGGFIILKIDNAVIYAFLIALFDALPVFGSGFILVPWAIGALINGAYPKAIGIASIYLAVTLVRNMLEAKIIGKQTGLHPLINLASVYIGLHLFGRYGLFLPPVIFFLYRILRPHKSATAVK